MPRQKKLWTSVRHLKNERRVFSWWYGRELFYRLIVAKHEIWYLDDIAVSSYNDGKRLFTPAINVDTGLPDWYVREIT